MQPLYSRLTCHAHNRFTPSIVLWQHFVLPTRPLLHQPRLSSSAAGTAQDGLDDNGENVTSQEASGLGPLATESTETDKETAEPVPKIKRMTTGNGHWYRGHWYNSNSSIAKNNKTEYHSRQASLTKPQDLLAAARAAFAVAEVYEGVVVKPMVHPRPFKESKLPWCLHPTERAIPGIDRLAVEIGRFGEYARPGRYESIARKHVIEQVRSHVRTTLPDHILEVFGSEKTGIALATSDIDLRLIRLPRSTDPARAKFPPIPETRFEILQDLHKLHWHGLRTHKAYILTTFRHARYPLISLQDRQSGLDVQVVLANDTSLSRVIMQDYLEQYPYLRQLYYVVKTIFDVRGLSDVFRGGFGSYSLFMMIVASIRHNPHPRNDAAGGFINFLKFWRDFDTRKHAISIEPVELFDKNSFVIRTDTIDSKVKEGKLKPLPPYMLSLRDPADETNDLGRKGIAIKHVQATFGKLIQQLEHDMKANTRESLLGPSVGSSYKLNVDRRAQLRSYGVRLTNQMQTSLAAKAQAIREAEDTEKMDEEMKEEAEMQRLAREDRDREWQRLKEDFHA